MKAVRQVHSFSAGFLVHQGAFRDVKQRLTDKMNLEMANELQEATLFYPSLHILKVCVVDRNVCTPKVMLKSLPLAYVNVPFPGK